MTHRRIHMASNEIVSEINRLVRGFRRSRFRLATQDGDLVIFGILERLCPDQLDEALKDPANARLDDPPAAAMHELYSESFCQHFERLLRGIEIEMNCESSRPSLVARRIGLISSCTCVDFLVRQGREIRASTCHHRCPLPGRMRQPIL